MSFTAYVSFVIYLSYFIGYLSRVVPTRIAINKVAVILPTARIAGQYLAS